MTVESRWLDNLVERNKAFTARVDENSLPVARTPGRAALITCMDPRVNPEALGIDPFGSRGQGSSDVRIIRTIGGMAEDRSLIVGIHLAGIKEFAVVMHTDCGNCLAKQRIDKIADGLQATMAPEDFESFRDRLGDAGRRRLLAISRLLTIRERQFDKRSRRSAITASFRRTSLSTGSSTPWTRRVLKSSSTATCAPEDSGPRGVEYL